MSLDVNLYLKQTNYTEPFPVAPLTIEPLTVLPVAVHLKELNQIAPLVVDSLRVDHVRHIDPLQIDQLNISSLPTVNLTMSQLPTLDISVRRAPPIAVALHQQFEMCSNYAMAAKVLGLPLMTLSITGRTTITPKDCVRPEQSKSHERSFPDVAALGSPGIPTLRVETCTVATRKAKGRPPARRRHPLSAGAPRHGFSLQQSGAAAAPIAAINGG